MGFHKGIGSRIRAGNQKGRAGYGASRRSFRWATTVPTVYWRIAGAGDTDTTVPDVSKRGLELNGYLSGTINTVSGALVDKTWNTDEAPPGSSQCLYLDGSTNWVHVLYNANLKPTATKLSISMWIKTTDQNGYMLSSEAVNGTTGWVYTAVGQPSSGAEVPASVFFYSAAGAAWVRDISAPVVVANDGAWHNVVYVYDEAATNSVAIYQDGVEVAASDGPSGGWNGASDNDVPIQLGSRQNESQFYKFYLDEIAYFSNIGLTAAQAKDLYNNGQVPDSYAGIRRG